MHSCLWGVVRPVATDGEAGDVVLCQQRDHSPRDVDHVAVTHGASATTGGDNRVMGDNWMEGVANK